MMFLVTRERFGRLHYTLQSVDSNAEEHIRGPFSRKYIARALVLLRVPQDNLLVPEC